MGGRGHVGGGDGEVEHEEHVGFVGVGVGEGSAAVDGWMAGYVCRVCEWGLGVGGGVVFSGEGRGWVRVV